VKELYSNAYHQLITSPAALSGLLTMSVIVSERPSLIVTVPSQGTHKSIAASGAERWSNRLQIAISNSFGSTNKVKQKFLTSTFK
jgi:superoxide dismutase